MQRCHVFLDLEDTIITPANEGWHKTELINVKLIKDFIEKFQPDIINIFSFAIWDQHQLQLFNTHSRPMIEDALGITFSLIPTVDDMILPACCEIMKINKSLVDFSEMCSFWGKHEAFRLFTRSLFKNTWKDWGQATNVALLDDAVINEVFHWPDLKVSGSIVNIDSISGWQHNK